MNVKKTLIATLMVFALFFPHADARAIILDGDISDWSGISPTITDPPDMAPWSDVLSVLITDDATNVYFLVNLADNPSPYLTNVQLNLNTDLDIATGWGGYEYNMAFVADSDGNPDFWIDDFTDGVSWDLWPNANDLQAVYGPSFIEASVPISTLQIVTPTITGFGIWSAWDVSMTGTYYLGSVPPPPVPEPATMLLLGSGLLGLAGFRRKFRKS